MEKSVNNAVIYTAFFLTDESVRKLENFVGHKILVPRPHITVRFRPNSDELYPELVGKNCKFRITGIGKSEENEGVLVTLIPETENVSIILEKVQRPHVTTWVSVDGKAVNTAFLNFVDVEDNLEVEGKFGWFNSEKN